MSMSKKISFNENKSSDLAFWPLNTLDGGQCIQDIFTRKPYTKINTIGRLHVINALDNGHSKMDVAREYGVHPQTVAYIYKQKDNIIKKYKQKLTAIKDVRSLNLSISLLEWIKQEFKNGTVIYEEQMCNKAREILSSSSEDKFESLDEWMVDFQQRYNIIKHSADSDLDVQSSEQWLKLTERFPENDLYVGGTCALLYRLELDNYLEGRKADTYVSMLFITNCSGADKKELLIVGEDNLANEDSVRSLPVEYYHQNNCTPLLNFNTVQKYLQNWDIKLSLTNKHVALLLDIPDIYLEQLQFDNITLINPASVNFARKALERIILCFKYHYRKLQITKFFTSAKESNNSILSYLNMIGLAWYSVPVMYIHKLYYPPLQGSLQLHDNEDEMECNTCTLSDWSKSYNLPLDEEVHPILDDYVYCDKNLPSIDQQININDNNSVMPDLSQNGDMSTTGIEAYQAMKRLIAYLQGEEASASIIKSARSLETQLEYGALSEIQQFASENSTNNDTDDL